MTDVNPATLPAVEFGAMFGGGQAGDPKVIWCSYLMGELGIVDLDYKSRVAAIKEWCAAHDAIYEQQSGRGSPVRARRAGREAGVAYVILEAMS